MKKITVIIADDHEMVRQGLKQIIELEEDIEVIAQASNGEEAIQLTEKLNPDVILMDINMPEINGIQAIEELKKKKCSSKIIVLTIHSDQQYLLKTIQLGAAGYVSKDVDCEVLIRAIRGVYNGETYVQPNMSSDLIKELSSRENIYKLLTRREIDVLKLIAEGMLNKEIAKTLNISEKTVKNHVSSIFKKLKVSDRTQAAVYAFKNKIVES